MQSGFSGATPAQDARLALSSARADAAIAQMRNVQPDWRPPATIAGTSIEDEIARNEYLASTAQTALIRSGIAQREALSTKAYLLENGAMLGKVFENSRTSGRTVEPDVFNRLLGNLAQGARPVGTEARYAGQWYQRADKIFFGVRMSNDNGLTIDFVKATDPFFYKLKVHQK